MSLDILGRKYQVLSTSETNAAARRFVEESFNPKESRECAEISPMDAKIATCIVRDFRVKIFPTTTQREQVPRHIEAGLIDFVCKEFYTLGQNGLF